MRSWKKSAAQLFRCACFLITWLLNLNCVSIFQAKQEISMPLGKHRRTAQQATQVDESSNHIAGFLATSWLHWRKLRLRCRRKHPTARRDWKPKSFHFLSKSWVSSKHMGSAACCQQSDLSPPAILPVVNTKTETVQSTRGLIKKSFHWKCSSLRSNRYCVCIFTPPSNSHSHPDCQFFRNPQVQGPEVALKNQGHSLKNQ